MVEGSAPGPQGSSGDFDERREDRRQDRGRGARRPRQRVGGWGRHLTVGALLSTFLGGGGYWGLSDLRSTLAVQTVNSEAQKKALEALAKAADEARADQARHLDEQSKALEQLRLTLVEMRAHGDATERTAERAALQLIDLGKSSERSSVRLDDHERRLQVIEQQGRK